MDEVVGYRQVKDLGFKKFLLLDDNIFSDREYLDKLLSEIKKKKMEWMSQCDIRIGRDKDLLKKLAESGCTTLSFGLESLSRESLKGMNKAWANPLDYPDLIGNIHSQGIDVSTEMVVGGEGDTLASIRDTKKFEVIVYSTKVLYLNPHTGTNFFSMAGEKNHQGGHIFLCGLRLSMAPKI